MKVLITGGAGFIGFHLANYLANHEYDVTILDNFERQSKEPDLNEEVIKNNIALIEGDVTLSETFDKLDNDYDQIYHLAAINGTANFYKIPDRVLKVGVLGTINILDWFVKCKKGKLLFSSSSEAYSGALKLLGKRFPIPTPEEVPLVVDNPKNVRWSYGASKLLGEVAMHSYAKAYSLKDFVIIRYHNIYGPRMGYDHVVPQFIRRIVKKENPFVIYGGNETRSFCYIDNALKATKLVMESPKTNGQTIHIGRSDDEIKIADLAKKLFKIVGVNPALDIRPAPEGSSKRRCPDTTKLRNLGFTAKIDLDYGLSKCYEWYKDKF
ncbi:NAD(P)-dependent oxidoreductase [Candidatus Woesearchaeota archaeon]|nr:NAD(P)-dependent oxidoreductase [Candidatus Woesearchaeota archaeon]